jgi:hypothetical protein
MWQIEDYGGTYLRDIYDEMYHAVKESTRRLSGMGSSGKAPHTKKEKSMQTWQYLFSGTGMVSETTAWVVTLSWLQTFLWCNLWAQYLRPHLKGGLKVADVGMTLVWTCGTFVGLWILRSGFPKCKMWENRKNIRLLWYVLFGGSAVFQTIRFLGHVSLKAEFGWVENLFSFAATQEEL